MEVSTAHMVGLQGKSLTLGGSYVASGYLTQTGHEARPNNMCYMYCISEGHVTVLTS